MAEGQVLIKDLPEAQSVSDSSFIPVDNGNLTQKITVENFNESSNQTAKGYAQQAAASATTAQEAIADVNNKVDLAQGFANSAAESSRNSQTYATNSQTYAGNSQGYANTAQGHATNAAASATAASGSAEAANAAATLSKSFCQGGTGAREGENTNNAKYWASVAQTAAQLTIDDHLDPVSTNPVENKVIYEALQEVHTGGSIVTLTTNESTLRGKTASITNGTSTVTADIDQTGKAVFEGVLMTGTLTVSASDGTRTATSSITIPYYGAYSTSLAFWSATIEVTTTTSQFDGLTVSAKKGGVVLASGTFTSGSASLTVPEQGTYTIEVTYDWKTYTTSVQVSAQTTYPATINGFFATVELSTTNTEFYGADIAVTLDGSPLDVELSFDSIGEASFTALQEGAYVFTVTYGGEPYTASVTVSEETTYTEEIKMWTATITVTGSSQLQLQPFNILKNGIQIGTAQFNAGGTANVIVHETGSYTFTADYDSYTYTSEAVSVTEETTYTASITVFIATLSITTSSVELYNQSISIEKGGVVVAMTAFSSSGSASARVHETGTYTCSCTYLGDEYSTDVTVSTETTYPVVIDLNITVTVTVYSATEDTISWTDERGSQVATFSTGASSKQIDVVVAPNGQNVTFTSSVAKDLENEDLTTAYSKTVNVTSSTATIHLMPDWTVYWYGYEDDTFTLTPTNYKFSDWGSTAVVPSATRNTNSIRYTVNGNQNGSVFAGPFDMSLLDSAKILITNAEVKGGSSYSSKQAIVSTTQYQTGYSSTARTDILISTGTGTINTPTFKTVDVSSQTSSQYVALAMQSVSSNPNYCEFAALWLE